VPRTVTLQCIEDRDAFLVVGSNWARTQHPAWSANFMAAEEVHVRRGNEQFAASVRLLRGSEREEAWNRVLAIWPNYQIAQDVAVGREFRLFALEPIR
jgi:deazaflavin-dependent oxidoreductase (nitroreductase family)